MVEERLPVSREKSRKFASYQNDRHTVFICISASLRSLNVKLITSGKDEFWPGRATVGLRCTSDSIEGRREIVEKFYNWCGEE